MVKITSAIVFAALAVTVNAADMPTGEWPTSTGTVYFTEPYTVEAGTTFDGELQTYERSDITCDGQTESGKSTAVFLVEPGATLKNVIIGVNQMEGVHCEQSGCTIENVWWADVCEDALSIKNGNASSISQVIGGGARYADDKVIQHNGYGTVTIDGFYVQDFGKLYRSCGTCKAIARTVTISNVYAVNPEVSLVTVNQNYGDSATLSNIKIDTTGDVDDVKVCQWSKGSTSGEPTMLGDGPSGTLCIYTTDDVTITQVSSSTTATTVTTTSSATSESNASASSEASSSETASSTASSSAESSASTSTSATEESASSASATSTSAEQSASTSSAASAPSTNSDTTSAFADTEQSATSAASTSISTSSSEEASAEAEVAGEAETTTSAASESSAEAASTESSASASGVVAETSATTTSSKCTRRRNL